MLHNAFYWVQYTPTRLRSIRIYMELAQGRYRDKHHAEVTTRAQRSPSRRKKKKIPSLAGYNSQCCGAAFAALAI